MKKIGVVFLLLILAACSKHEEHVESVPEYKVEDLSADILIPQKMWSHFWPEAENFIFSDIAIRVIEKNPGILLNHKLDVKLPRGGGSFNIREILTGERGTFAMQFLVPDFIDSDEVRVFFISRTKQISTGIETLGSGCYKLLNITTAFKKYNDKDGLVLNTTEGRHYAVAGGTFIFAAKKAGQNFITQVTITDSNLEEMNCQE